LTALQHLWRFVLSGKRQTEVCRTAFADALVNLDAASIQANDKLKFVGQLLRAALVDLEGVPYPANDKLKVNRTVSIFEE
jgi:hypothetical protein